MTDYSELVKALRICGKQTCCDNCPMYDNGLEPYECLDKLFSDAAAAIEAMQADVDILEEVQDGQA